METGAMRGLPAEGRVAGRAPLSFTGIMSIALLPTEGVFGYKAGYLQNRSRANGVEAAFTEL